MICTNKNSAYMKMKINTYLSTILSLSLSLFLKSVSFCTSDEMEKKMQMPF